MNINTMIKSLADIMRNDSGVNGDAQRIEQIVWMLFLKVYDAKEESWELQEDKYVSIIPDKFRWRNWAIDKKDGKAITGDTLLYFINELFNTLKSLEVDNTTSKRGLIVREVFTDLNNYMKDGVLIRQVVNVLNGIDLADYRTKHAFNEIYETILKDLQNAGTAGEFYTPRALTDFMSTVIAPKIGDTIADFACGTGGFLISALSHLDSQVSDTEDKEKVQKAFYGVEKKSLPYLLCVTNLLLHDIDEPFIMHDNSLEKNVRDYDDKDMFDVILMNPPYGGSEKKDIQSNFPVELRSAETADLFIIEILYRLKQNGKVGIVLPDGFLFGEENNKIAIKKKLLEEYNLHTIIRLPATVFKPYASLATNLLFFDKTTPTEEVWFYRMDMPKGYKSFSKTKPITLEHMKTVLEWWNNRVEIKDEKNDDSLTETWKSKKYSIKEIIDSNYNLDLCGFPKKEDVILSPEETTNNFIEKRENLETGLKLVTKSIFDLVEDRNTNISEKSVSSIINKLNFLILEFPENIKKSILQFAICGKLSERLESDIAIEKKFSQLKFCDAKEVLPFEIPSEWKWIRFEDLVDYNMGKTPPRKDPSHWGKDYNWVSISDMVSDGFIETTKEKVSDNAIKHIFKERISKKGTLLMSFKLTVGKVSILNIDAVHNEAIISIYPKYDENDIVKRYLFKILPAIVKYGNTKGAIKGNTLNSKSLGNLLIPIPSLEEQKRIIEKLDNILPLIGSL